MIKRNREQRDDKNVKVISGFIWEFKGEFCLEGLEARWQRLIGEWVVQKYRPGSKKSK